MASTSNKADWTGHAVPWLDASRDPGEQLAERLTPEILWQIVADVYDIAKTEEERDSGLVRIGRRPAREEVPLEEVLLKLLPNPYGDLPFPEALRVLMKGRSQREFAQRVPCDQSTLSRLLSGKLKPDRRLLEGLARAGGQGPWYFVEWRALFVADLVAYCFMQRPHQSAQIIRRLVGAGRG